VPTEGLDVLERLHGVTREAIVDGQKPMQLTGDRLLLRKDLPFDWRKQQQFLGFEFEGSGRAAK
jgi:hypothetical protein